MLTLRVGVRVAMVALRVMSTERSGASKPLAGVVLAAPPVFRPPMAARKSVGTAYVVRLGR
jgi:hypothetical protein